MSGISKQFGSVQALDSVDLHVQSGTIHALVGENGAGKTTLMKALYGALTPDQGQIKIEGSPVSMKSSAQAIRLGVGMVSQHYGIIPDLTCLENLILGAEGGPLLNRPEAARRAENLAQKMGFEFNWDRNAAELSPAGSQKLEILKLLWRQSRIMILDEPTAMLSPADGEALFQSLRLLTQEGNTVILVTHRLPEVFDHCAQVTVLRGGKKVAERSVAETNPVELAEWIVGRKMEDQPPHAPKLGESALEVKNLTVRGPRGNDAVKSANLTLRRGEMVGIAGVDGSGQRELIHALIGTAKVLRGSIKLDGEELSELPTSKRIERGCRLIPEDRHEEGVVEEWSLAENAALGLQRLSPFAVSGAVDVQGRYTRAEAIAERFHTKHGGLTNPMASLSGGNQQRFVAARALENDPRLVLAFQPARGLDLAATRDVYDGLRAACEQRAAVLVVSYDLDELLDHCDRVVAMNRGELFEPKPGEERDRDAIGCLMVGAV